ncbi:LOW QUALITY PROTEIN: hypothetical protein QC764_102690 [Podospora pseudoanserina]|uniref:Acetyl-CoA synthetase-like protein n=1 Tax=Podospora pseudoanserina TaxID=2609844 RepID=A0ABR0ILA7_9PEZI|nr:LOW QUALITY PROTEIN: hypothetical protein QC764_102690 [Podospora pseudoanserina]
MFLARALGRSSGVRIIPAPVSTSSLLHRFRISSSSSSSSFTGFRMVSTLPKLPVFEAISKHDPESTVVIHSKSGRRFQYGELLGDVAKARDRLYESAGREDLDGERIAFLAENSYDYVANFTFPTHRQIHEADSVVQVTLLAILGAKSIAVPMSPAFPASELQYILNHSEALMLLATGKFASKAQEVLKTELDVQPTFLQLDKLQGGGPHEKVTLDKSSPGSAGMMLYTSGTTNRPKGVLIPQAAMTAQARSLIQAWEYAPSDHLLHLLPLHHIHGTINAIFTPLFTGSSIEFLYPFNADAVWKHLQEPAREAISPAHLRLTISGSAALPTPIKRAWADLSKGNILLERFGMTEVGMALSCGLDPNDRVDGSVGWPLPGVEARLVDVDTHQVIEKGQEKDLETGRERVGEIQLRGPTIFAEYWRNEEATKKEFVEGKDGRGSWFKTGDVAVRRPGPEKAGRSEMKTQREWARGDMYFILGRKSADIIKSGGEKVSALEVEREMLSLPQVAEVAVLAVPSGKWGQKVGAVVILDREHCKEGKWSPLEMRRALKERLAGYKIPQVLRVVDHIPRNAMGKINKKVLVKEVFREEFSGDEM